MPAMAALRKLKQEDHGLKASLGYTGEERGGGNRKEKQNKKVNLLEKFANLCGGVMIKLFSILDKYIGTHL